MTRRLVVCADGTWNTPGETSEGKPAPTNVCKMRDALAPKSPDGSDQLSYYHEGVGTGNVADHFAGGMLGEGIDRNIQDCYRWLVENYQPGDSIFLFGFSRGAYTVRSLAGLIRNCGLLLPQHVAKVGDAYAFYRDRSDLTQPSSPASDAFRAQYSRDVSTTFIGVWDTVGALGIPIHILRFLDRDKYEFHDVRLSSTVKYAFQALAIDEERVPFEPCVWDQQLAPGQILSQVWFAGVHSNVGGGYADCGLSDLTFQWMSARATDAGLGLTPGYLAAQIQANAKGRVYDSMGPIYKPFGRLVRPIRKPRVDAKGAPIDTKESLHRSALERWDNDSSYVARNIKDYIMRYPTSSPGAVSD